MIQDVWKKFDNAELSHSSVHYLLAIHTLSQEQGYARAVDIANYLELTRGSVSITLNKLVSKGYVVEDSNKFLSLSTIGLELVNAVLSKRRLVEQFLATILRVSPAIAEEDACKVEHLLTKETSAKLLSFIGFYLSDNPEAVSFRQAFARYRHMCEQHDDSCQICEIECYFAGNEELFINTHADISE